MDTHDRRIGIVGGGASGLAAAHALARRGFERVKVLEQGPEVGGKCCTIWHEGRSYELGAAILTPAYRHTWALAERYGMTPKLCLGIAYVDAESGRCHANPYLPPALGLGGAVRLPFQIGRIFLSDLARRRRDFPRLDKIEPTLAEPFEAWCTRHEMRALLETMRPWTTPFGYGYMDEVPAAYMLNYLCLAGPTYELHDQGYRGLWRRVAEDLDVVCDARVKRITRGATIKVTTDAQSFEFDDLILACPLKAALSFLDVSEEERSLFEQVRYVDYQVVAAEVSGLQKTRYVFVPRHFDRTGVGKPMFYYRRYADRDLITFYCFPDRNGEEGAKEEIKKLVRRMGGTVRSFVTTHLWRYFPHVSSESMRARFHAKFEEMQGARHTYYASEVLSFSCVEPVVAYATDLVERRFGSAVGPALTAKRRLSSPAMPSKWRSRPVA